MTSSQCLHLIIFLLTLKMWCIDASVTSNITIKTEEEYNYKCSQRICVMKCCPDDLYVGFDQERRPSKVCLRNNDTSISSSQNFDETVIYDKKLTVTGNRLKDVFYLVESELLSFAFDDAYDLSSLFNIYMLEDGSLELEQPNYYERWTHVNRDEMCVDYVLPKSGTREKYAVKFFINFIETPKVYRKGIKFVASTVLISCVFLIVVLMVYLVLPELRNLCGMILMSYVASLFVGFLMLGTLLLVTLDDEHADRVCFGFTITIYYFFLASSCWMDVMSFDIWWTFRRYDKAQPIHCRGKGFTFGVYCVYSWGLPAALTAFMVGIDSVDLRHIPWFIQPKMLDSGCLIAGGGKLLYLYVPMLILIIINWMFLIMTAFNVWRLSRGITVLDSPAASAYRKHRDRFMLYLKLSVIMGVSWVLEVVISQVSPGASLLG